MGEKTGGYITAIIILCLIILAGVVVNLGLRECTSNRDCAANAYCGTDHECHNYPENIVVKESNFIPAALIVAAGFIGAALIYRKKL
jgi:hypothetical protein